jgi:vacuolar-type H+-ATPase subunit E/Vma4
VGRADDMASATAPVSEALIEAARRRAEEALARATEDARTELVRAHAQAESLLAQARADGTSAAERIAALQLAATRREAHETVLAARRHAYEMLRHDAIEALIRRSSTTEGRNLADRLSALVEERLGGAAAVRPVEPDPLAVEAESGNRRAAIGPTSLVDHVLLSMTEEVERLWA